MSEPAFFRMQLCAPLLFRPCVLPFPPDGGMSENSGEQIFCFEIDPAQSISIEPLRESFPGTLVFSGCSSPANATANEATTTASPEKEELALPAGFYLFTQEREALDREACITMAIEQQTNGLWERYQPENRLYFRFLFEDGKSVTQVFRPYHT